MTTETAAPLPRRRNRAGVAALCCSIALIAWVVVMVYLAISASGNEVAGTIAYVMFFASWIVVPLLAVGLLVLGTIALLLNPVFGKILGACAIVAPVVAVVVAWGALGSVDHGMLAG